MSTQERRASPKSRQRARSWPSRELSLQEWNIAISTQFHSNTYLCSATVGKSLIWRIWKCPQGLSIWRYVRAKSFIFSIQKILMLINVWDLHIRKKPRKWSSPASGPGTDCKIPWAFFLVRGLVGSWAEKLGNPGGTHSPSGCVGKTKKTSAMWWKQENGAVSEWFDQRGVSSITLSLVVNAYSSNVGTGRYLIPTDYFKEIKVFLKHF